MIDIRQATPQAVAPIPKFGMIYATGNIMLQRDKARESCAMGYRGSARKSIVLNI